MLMNILFDLCDAEFLHFLWHSHKVIYNFHRHLPSPFTSDKNIMLQYASCALTLQNCILKVDCHILIAENETQ